MKALDSELFKDAPSNGILKVHQSMVCKNQNPTLPLNRAQKEENINKRKKSMVEIAIWGGGAGNMYQRPESSMWRRQMVEPRWQRQFLIGLRLNLSPRINYLSSLENDTKGGSIPIWLQSPALIQCVIRTLLGNLSAHRPNGPQSGWILKLVIWEQTV